MPHVDDGDRTAEDCSGHLAEEVAFAWLWALTRLSPGTGVRCRVRSAVIAGLVRLGRLQEVKRARRDSNPKPSDP
jgi:hypothetical protein